MPKQMHTAQKLLCTLLAAVSLASCAATVPQTVQSPQPATGAAAQPDFGKIISIRPVKFSAGQTTSIAGVNAVLAALGEEAVAPPVTGEEIVIQTDNGSPAALAQRSQPTSLAVGQRVLVVQRAPVAIIGRN